MKIFLKISFFIVLLTTTLFAHKEWVHQYIVREAYRYLELKLGFTYPDLKNHIGFNFDGYGDDNDPWATGYVGVATWREDKDDPIWGYGTEFNGWTASSTHFWNADLGDNIMTPIFASSDVPNAYTKARIYLFGGHRLFFMKKSWSYEHQQVILGRFYSYNSLTRNTDSNTTKGVDRRKFFMSLSIGVLEIIGVGFGYQYSEQWSFAVKPNITVVPGRAFIFPPIGGGIGFKMSRYLQGLPPVNNVSIQTTILYSGEYRLLSRNGRSGFSIEINIGNENIKASQLNVFWSIGAVVSTIKKERPLYFYSLRIGLNWNF